MAYDRSPSKNIYLNVAVNTLKKLRGLVPSTVPSLSSELGQLCAEGIAEKRLHMGFSSRDGPWVPTLSLLPKVPSASSLLPPPSSLLPPPSLPSSTNGAPQPLHSEWLSECCTVSYGRRERVKTFHYILSRGPLSSPHSDMLVCVAPGPH